MSNKGTTRKDWKGWKVKEEVLEAIAKDLSKKYIDCLGCWLNDMKKAKEGGYRWEVVVGDYALGEGYEHNLDRKGEYHGDVGSIIYIIKKTVDCREYLGRARKELRGLTRQMLLTKFFAQISINQFVWKGRKADGLPIFNNMSSEELKAWRESQ